MLLVHLGRYCRDIGVDSDQLVICVMLVYLCYVSVAFNRFVGKEFCWFVWFVLVFVVLCLSVFVRLCCSLFFGLCPSLLFFVFRFLFVFVGLLVDCRSIGSLLLRSSRSLNLGFVFFGHLVVSLLLSFDLIRFAWGRVVTLRTSCWLAPRWWCDVSFLEDILLVGASMVV